MDFEMFLTQIKTNLLVAKQREGYNPSHEYELCHVLSLLSKLERGIELTSDDINEPEYTIFKQFKNGISQGTQK